MPMSFPRKSQTQSEFINSCLSNKTMQQEFPDQKQRVAVCYSQWREYKKKSVKKQVVYKSLQLINLWVKGLWK